MSKVEKERKNILVLFGGRAPEHEVSIITGIQILNALDKDKYNLLPLYISKKGEWFLGNSSYFKPVTFKDLAVAEKIGTRVFIPPEPSGGKLISRPGAFTIGSLERDRVDIAFPAFHGRYGEDGTIQGLFELADIPYVGCGVQASSLSMNKVLSKRIAKSCRIPTLQDIWFSKETWENKRTEVLKVVSKAFSYPAFVKPVHLGSSIGIGFAEKRKELEEALDVAFFYDNEVMVEAALENAIEVNISLLGNDPYDYSSTEQPVSSGRTLTFEDKYIGESGTSKGMATAKRIMPAPIKAGTEEKIRSYASDFFREIGGTGIARLDFLLSGDERSIYFNEANTMPGSVAFYLWKERGINFTELTDRLIKLAMQAHNRKASLITTFDSNILSGFSGSKGAKL